MKDVVIIDGRQRGRPEIGIRIVHGICPSITARDYKEPMYVMCDGGVSVRVYGQGNG